MKVPQTLAIITIKILITKQHGRTKATLAGPPLNDSFFPTPPPQRDDMFQVFDCNSTKATFITETNENSCMEIKHPAEKLEAGQIVHYPLPTEHTVYECKLTLTIKGSHCGYFSIQYPNLDEIEKLTLTRKQCLDLHKGAEITLDHLPLRIDNRKGSVRPFNLIGKPGFNIIENNVGTTTAAGSCTAVHR